MVRQESNFEANAIKDLETIRHGTWKAYATLNGEWIAGPSCKKTSHTTSEVRRYFADFLEPFNGENVVLYT